MSAVAPVRVGVVGVGIAGRARVRALARFGEVELVGVHRGRFAADTGAEQLDADTLIARSDLVIVASPSETHEDWVRRLLEADRHVIVEYPLARTAEAAQALFALARSRRRMLHVEHIELLSPTTSWMADAVRHAGHGSSQMSFTSGGPAWSSAGEHGWQQVSRLHRLVAAHGFPHEVEVRHADGERLEVCLQCPRGPAELVALRGESRSRALAWALEAGGRHLEIRDREAFIDGLAHHLPSVELFYDDTRRALLRLSGAGGSYVDDALLVEVIRLAERVGQGRGSFQPRKPGDTT